MELLEKNSLALHINDGPYPDETIYRFLVEELLNEEIDDINILHMTTNFIYEEFHPNHEANIRSRCTDFLESWLNREFSDYRPSLSEFLLSPSGEKFTKEEVFTKVDNFFSAFSQFQNTEFSIEAIQFEKVEDSENLDMLGFAEGRIKYDAVLENGETTHVSGQFKIFVSCRWEWWNINTFIMPGFIW